MVRFLIDHPAIHRAVHRVWTRGKREYELPDGSIQFPACPIDAIVWRDLLHLNDFAAAIAEGHADLAAGRGTLYVWRDGALVNADTGEPMA